MPQDPEKGISGFIFRWKETEELRGGKPSEHWFLEKGMVEK